MTEEQLLRIADAIGDTKSTNQQLQEQVIDAAHAFGLRLADHAVENIGRWGMQDARTLCICMAEELGEVSRAVLEHFHAGEAIDHAARESDDLGALCIQMMLLLSRRKEVKNEEV